MIACPQCGSLATPGASDCQKCGIAFAPALSEPTNSKPENVLRWWLYFAAFWAVVNLATVISALLSSCTPAAAHSLLWSLLVATTVRLAAVTALINWRKWGLYVYVASAVAYSLLSTTVIQLAFPLLGAAIMWFLVKKAWPKFR